MLTTAQKVIRTKAVPNQCDANFANQDPYFDSGDKTEANFEFTLQITAAGGWVVGQQYNFAGAQADCLNGNLWGTISVVEPTTTTTAAATTTISGMVTTTTSMGQAGPPTTTTPAAVAGRLVPFWGLVAVVSTMYIFFF